MYLLSPMHDGLKVSFQKLCLIININTSVTQSNASLFLPLTQPQYRKLGTNDWLNKSVFEKLMVSIETEIQDLQGAIESCHQVL